MIESKKFRKLIDALNSYYGFAVLVYTVTILIASNSRVAIWIAAGLTPFIFGWTGYVLRSFVEQRNNDTALPSSQQI